MKKLLFLFCVLAVSTGVFAQDSTRQEQDSSMSMYKKKKDCYLMKEGKLMMMKHGDTSMMKPVNQPVTLNNGATVGMDGTITLPDGTTKTLKDGWYVDLDGKMGKHKMPMKEDKL